MGGWLLSRRDGAIVAWHEVPGTSPPQKSRPVGYGLILALKKPTPARGPLGWFFRGFNYGFDRVTSGYGAVVNSLIRKAARSMLLLVVVGGIWLLSKEVPGGFIPDEDKGVLFISVQLPAPRSSAPTRSSKRSSGWLRKRKAYGQPVRFKL
jgi:multidrug efflux pump subunit AcrB